MNTKIFSTSLAICLFIGSFVFAQTHRFIYEYQFKEDSTATNFKKENMVLDINPDEVKFYDYNFVTIDSTNITKGQGSAIWNNLPALVRKKNSFTNTNYDTVDLDMFSYETHDEMQWKLTKETKKVGNYNLQKATTRFGGRDWEAWFETEMPFTEGPYKFRGLPGLIFEIIDTEGNFKFTLLKSYKLPKTYDTSGFLGQFAGKKALAVKENVLVKKKLENYQDPLRTMREDFKNNYGNGKTSFWLMNTEIKNIEQFNELTKIVQQFIRKNNNPIERNKAIRYE